MLIKPDLIVYLWMFPVVLFFFFPVLCFPLVLLGDELLKARRQTAGERRSVVQPAGYALGEKRKYPRQKVVGVIAQVSDGVRCCRGSIADISQFGLRLVVPKDGLDKGADKLGVLLTGAGERSMQMRVKPRWNNERGGEVSIGASIEETIGGWDSFAKEGCLSQVAV
jgi:hypothetical protein